MSNRISRAAAGSPPERSDEPRPAAEPRRASTGAALCGLAIAATAFLVRPVESALSNWDEIDLTLGEMLLELLPWLAFAGAGLALAGVLLVRLFGQRAADLLAATTLALFVQGTFLAFDYGPFDGRAIDWAAHWPEALAELVVWGGLLGVSLARPGLLAARAVAIGVLVLGAASVLTTAAIATPLADRLRKDPTSVENASRGQVGPEIVTSFSRSQNVLVVVLDMFQSDFFAEAMEDPALSEAMPPGFVFYRNAVALYPSTQLSLQSILTSRSLDPNQPVGAWRAAAMQQSIPAALSRSGFQASLLTFSPQNLACLRARHDYACLTPGHLLALARGDASTAAQGGRRTDARKMLATAWFRLAPWIVKPWIYDEGHWQLGFVHGPEDQGPDNPGPGDPGPDDPDAVDAIDPRLPSETRSDLAIFDLLLARTDADSPRPTFRLIHLFATHFPNSLDASCGLARPVGGRARNDAERGERRRGRAISTARCALSRVFAWLDRLDELGAYDPSLIFVVADHGHPAIPLASGDASPPLPEGPLGEPGASMPPAGVPLFLVKEPGDRDPLRISDKPVSLCDIPSSITDSTGHPSHFECQSVFSGAERGEPREHLRLEKGSGQRPPYRMQRWIVDGHSWRASSWQAAALP